MSEYAVYKRKIYELDQTDRRLELISRSKESLNDGFREIKFEQGFISKVLYVKDIDISDLEFAYDLEYRAVYKGMEFEPLAIGKFVLDQHYIMITTNDRDIAEKFQFEKKEPFVFDKQIPLNEIDALIEIKIPLLRFKSLGEKRTRIESKDIKTYLLKQK